MIKGENPAVRAILRRQGTSLGAQHLPQEMQVQYLGREDPLEKEMATRSSILAWGNPVDRGAWRAAVNGVVKFQTRFSN